MPQSVFRFEEFELDPDRFQLRRLGKPQKLERIPMELLTLLIENRGKVVDREAIVARLWGKDVFVEAEHSINTAINKIRRVLRDDPGNPRFVQTVFGKGYRFLAATTVIAESDASVAPMAEKREPIARPCANGDSAILDTPDLVRVGTAGTSSRESIGPEPTFKKVQAEAQIDITPAESGASVHDGSRHRFIWLIIGLLAAGTIAYATFRLIKGERSASTPAAGYIRSIVVLPMANLSGDPDQQYLVDGMTDQLITDLARMTSVRVISRTSTMRYQGVRKSLPDIARELNIDAAVEGSVLATHGDVRITAQLLDARNDRHLWAQTYKRKSTDLFAMQDEVAENIAHQIAAELEPARSKRRSQQNISSQAYDAYLRGRYFWNLRTLAYLMRSIDYYQQAITLAPDFAPAYAALGDAYAVISYRGGPPPSEAYPLARDAAEKALQLDDSLAEAHALLGEVKVNYEWDWAGGEKEFRRALELDSNYPTAHHWYAIHLAVMGRQRDALAEIDKAYSLDPLSLVINETRAEILYWGRDMVRAGAVVGNTLELDTHFPESYAIQGKVFEQEHEFGKALDSLRKAVDLSDSNPKMLMLWAHAMALSGKKDVAKATIAGFVASKQGRFAATDLAAVYCAMGQNDNAMNWFAKGYQNHEEEMTQLAVDPLFDGCRSDPRFQEFLRRLNLGRYPLATAFGAGSPIVTAPAD